MMKVFIIFFNTKNVISSYLISNLFTADLQAVHIYTNKTAILLKHSMLINWKIMKDKSN